MIDQNNDLFKIEDNFAKTAHIQSIPIFEAKIDFVPKITIAIPTYKRAELLKEALDSAINQTGFDEYDILVVDNNPERDCETEFLLATYSESNITYYKNSQNLGMFGNWNKCIELSKSKWITILHDDDALHPNFLEYFFKTLQKNPKIKSFVCSMYKVGENVTFTNVEFENKLKLIKNKTFLLGNVTPFPGVVFHRDIDFRFNEDLLICDYDFWIRLASKGGFYKSPMKLAFYRMSMHQESSSVYKELLIKTKEYRMNFIINNFIDKYISEKSLNEIERFYEKCYNMELTVRYENFFMNMLTKLYVKIWC